MTTLKPEARILIIGAGLAGLSLAQGLKLADPPLPFHIFERDPNDGFRPQGYRIRLAQDGTDALRTLIPDSLWQAIAITAANTGKGGQRINAVTGEAADSVPQPGPPKDAQQAKGLKEAPSISVDRGVLRNVLLDGLAPHISFDKKFESYIVRPDGTVEAKFSDGSVEVGCLLVGADGTRSAIRHRLLPELKILDTEIRAVFGKAAAIPETLSRMAQGLKDATCIFHEGERSHTIMYSEYLRFSADAALKARYRVPEDYLYWVLCYHADRTDDDDERHKQVRQHLSMSAEETKQRVLDIVHDWHDAARAVPETLDPASTATLSFVVSDKQSFSAEWDKLRTSCDARNDPATLLGDAAHPSPPLGRGGNSAFEESAELCRRLVSASRAGGGAKAWLEAVMAYESVMLEKAKPWVEFSGVGASKLFGMKPVQELKPADF